MIEKHPNMSAQMQHALPVEAEVVPLLASQPKSQSAEGCLATALARIGTHQAGRADAQRPITLDFSDLAALSELPAALADLPQVVSLNLANTQLRDLTVLASLPRLQVLNLWRCPFDDIGPLRSCAELRWLNLGRTQVKDLSPLSGLTRLVHLDLSETAVTDIAPLQAMLHLREIILRGSAVASADALQRLRDIRILDVAQSPLADAPIDLPASRCAVVLRR